MAGNSIPILVSRLIRQVRSRQNTYLVGSLVTIALNSMSLVVFGLTTALSARLLGPTQTGFLTWLVSGTTAISMFADPLGIYYSNAYLLAKEGHRDQMGPIRGTVLAYGLVIGILSAVICGYLTPIRTALFAHFDGPQWKALIALNICGLLIFRQITSLYWGRSQFILLGSLNLFRTIMYAVLAVVTLLVLHARTGVAMGHAQVFSTWLADAAALVMMLHSGIGKPDIGYLKRCIAVGWRASAANSLGYLQLRVDQWLVNALLGPAALGLYGAVTTLGELLTRIPGMIALVVFPLAAGATDHRRAARSTTKRTLRIAAALGIVSLPIGYYADSLIRVVYGPAFATATPAFQLLLPAIVSLSAVGLVHSHLSGMGYPALQLAGIAASLVLNLGPNLALLPSLGIRGASIASSVSYMLWLVLGLLYLRAVGREPRPSENDAAAEGLEKAVAAPTQAV